MGWGGGHLWQFTERVYEGEAIAIPHEDDWTKPIDARKKKLNQVFETPGQKMIYTYDFGDDWLHEVVLEEVIDSKRAGSVVCAAKGKCPPDDCGGAFGYAELKKTLGNPKSRDYADMLDWLCLESADEWNAKEADVEPGDIVGTVDFDEFMF